MDRFARNQDIGKREWSIWCKHFSENFSRFRDKYTKYREKNEWLIRNFQGLKWKTGVFPYSEVENIISEMLSDGTIVCTDGAARNLWWGKMCDNKIIMNIRELGYSEPKDQKREVTECTINRCLRKVVCALNSANWMRSYAFSDFKEKQWVDI